MVTWHDLRLVPAEVDRLSYRMRRSGRTSPLQLTTPLRTWRDLAAHLPVPALIAAGDHLVRIPRPGLEGRERPWCTPDELLTVATGRHAGTLREAAAQVRIGADSPKETELRLAFAAAGLPEPELNVPLRGDAGETRQCPDFQWPQFRVCAEYDGRQHSDRAQVQRDIRRARAVKAAGYAELRLYQKDLENECADAVGIVRAELIERGWRPGG
ncbi:DUF559 domain-containing protein [Brachybacterium sp. UNK5269]|uniref:DUF559 domain-containing protein n=1 Tax=Brachybacterium sp. UNK5269 TaxID=3408576 RepID=UPI003BAE6676